MGYIAKVAIAVKVNGADRMVEPNEDMPVFGNVQVINTAILTDTETGLEVVVEAGGYLSRIFTGDRKPKKAAAKSKKKAK